MCFGIKEKIEETKKRVDRAILISKTAAITYAVMFILMFAMNIAILVRVFILQ